ncbi:MAG TPA: polysaccharide biosynthesis C-terminal domain-containing protein, partial [Bacteroidia bacterium]|nr:polysaccharide biosynthesis C-terminal domain-containing protein [Bacteroidia bacterium]
FSVFGAVITVVLNVLLIPFFGYLGAAWATLVCYASMMAVSYYYGQRYYPVPYDLAAFAYLIGSALLIFFLSEWLRGFSGSTWQTTLINSGLLLTWIGVAAAYEHRKKLPLSRLWSR